MKRVGSKPRRFGFEVTKKDAFQNDRTSRGRIDQEEVEVADKFGPRAELDKDADTRPAGLIKTLGSSGIEADAAGAWKTAEACKTARDKIRRRTKWRRQKTSLGKNSCRNHTSVG